MHFLHPAFLFALFTLAIPVIIHLFNFRRYKKVYFSNVQFLKEIDEQQASSRNLKERLILASRLLAIFFLVMAFARPYISNNKTTQGEQQAISVFVDNSYSMQALNKEGSLLDEAKQKAKKIASAYSINDRFQLLTQDFEGKHQRLLSRAEFNDEVDAVQVSAQSRNLEQIINRQQNLLNIEAGKNKHSYIISDFQKNISQNKPITNTGFPVSLIQIKANALPNVAVDSVWMLNAVHRPDETEKIVVRLKNYAEKKAEKIPLKLIINGLQKAIGSFTVNAGASQTDTLTFSGLQAGWQLAEIQLQDNPVTFDNTFYFTFNVSKQLPVLLVNEGTPNKYLNAVFSTDEFFLTKHVAYGNVDYASLATYPIIVLSDVKSISAGLVQQLNTYVSKGGTLMVFPSADADMSSYKNLLQPMGAGYFKSVITEPSKVTAINMQNNVFKNIFESSPQNPDLPVLKKYYELSNSAREYLMRTQTGNTVWQASKFGAGKVYVCAVALNEDFSNLPVHALFVPAVLRIAILSGHDEPLFYTIGNSNVIETGPIQSTEKQLIKLVKGNKTIIPELKQQYGNTTLYLPDDVIEPGVYKLQKKDSLITALAFNDNRKESDLTYLSADDLGKIFPNSPAVINADKLNANSITETANLGLQLWKLCIILTLIFLAAETLLVRYYKIGKNVVSQSVNKN